MLNTQVLILDGQTSALLKSCLWQLASRLKTEDATVLLLGKSEHSFQDDLWRTLCWYAYQQGFYQQTDMGGIPVQIQPLTAAMLKLQAGDKVRSVLGCPVSYLTESTAGADQDVVLSFSDEMLRLLARFESEAQLPADEERLLSALEYELAGKSAELDWITERNLETRLQELISTVSHQQVSLWEDPEWGPLYRCLMDMRPARSVFLPQRMRATLDDLIRKSLTDPSDEQSQLLLALFRRRLCDDYPESPLLTQILPREKAIQILPPIQNWTVSILVTTYNRMELLKRTIRGIQSQTYPHWKMILFDHGSTDETAEYCRQLAAEDARIHLIRKDVNLGARGLSKYHWDMFAPIDTELFCACPDDDWMEPQHLEKLVGQFQQRPWLALSFGSYRLVNRKGHPYHQYGPLYPEPSVTNPYIELQRIYLAGLCVQGGVMRKEALRSFAQWDLVIEPGFPYGIHDFLSTIYLQSLFEGACVPDVVFSMTADESTANSQFDISDRWLSVLESVARCFDPLYGFENYPYEIMVYYQKYMINNTTAILQNAMLDPTQMADMDFIQSKLKLLEKMALFGKEQMLRAARTREHLFEGKNSFRYLVDSHSTPQAFGPVETGVSGKCPSGF